MVLVFYCYGVRVIDDLSTKAKDGGLMFFQHPPAIGDEVRLRNSNLTVLIRQIDHFHMVIAVTPVAVMEAVLGS